MGEKFGKSERGTCILDRLEISNLSKFVDFSLSSVEIDMNIVCRDSLDVS